MGMSKEFFTRIQLKFDSWDNWQKVPSTFKPLSGEVCIVKVPGTGTSDLEHQGATSITKPAYLMKVGDGETSFHDLPWLSAKAADVHSWAKLDATKFVNWLNGTHKMDGTAVGEGNPSDCPITFATDAELASVSASLVALDTRVGTAEGKITTLEGTVEGHGTDIDNLKKALSGEGETSVTARVVVLEGEMDKAQADILKNAGDISTINSQLAVINGADTVDGSIAKALKDAKAYSDEQDTAQNATLKKYAEDEADAAESAAKTHADNLDTAIRADFASADTALGGRIDKLEEGYAGQSVAYIAKDVLSKELIPEGAQESLNTLREIGAWIQDHPEEAADMNEAIQNIENSVFVVTTAEDGSRTLGADKVAANATAISNEASRAAAAEGELQTQINALKGTGTGSVAEQISAAIGTAQTQWEAYADQAEESAVTRAGTAATTALNNAVSALNSKDTELSNAITTLNGDANTTGSVANKIKVANDAQDVTLKAYADQVAAAEAKAKADAAESAAKSYTDNKVSDLVGADNDIKERLNTLEGKVDVDKVSTAISAAEGRANTHAEEQASAAEGRANAYTDGKIGELDSAYKAADADITRRLGIIEGADTVQGSIAYAVKAEKDRAEQAESGLQSSIDTLNGKVDVAKVSEAISSAVGTEKSNRESAISALDTAYKAADTQIRSDFAAADTTTLNSAKSYADGKASAAETAAKGYADGLKTEIEQGYAAADTALENKYKDRPFVTVTENTKANWVVFNCGNAVDVCI